MKKSLSVLFTALLPALTLTSSNAMAHDDSQEHCYPLAHGEEGLGSRKTYHLPLMYARGNGWRTWINLQNISDKPVNVKLKLRSHQNTPIIATDSRFHYAFNSTNSPLATDLGGAILKPMEMGVIGIIDANTDNQFTAQILWQADACIDETLSGALRIHFENSSMFDQGLVLLNGGQPF